MIAPLPCQNGMFSSIALRDQERLENTMGSDGRDQAVEIAKIFPGLMRVYLQCLNGKHFADGVVIAGEKGVNEMLGMPHVFVIWESTLFRHG